MRPDSATLHTVMNQVTYLMSPHTTSVTRPPVSSDLTPASVRLVLIPPSPPPPYHQ